MIKIIGKNMERIPVLISRDSKFSLNMYPNVNEITKMMIEVDTHTAASIFSPYLGMRSIFFVEFYLYIVFIKRERSEWIRSFFVKQMF